MIYVVLASYNNEQSDMLHKLYANTALQKAPLHLYVFHPLSMTASNQSLQRSPQMLRYEGTNALVRN